MFGNIEIVLLVSSEELKLKLKFLHKQADKTAELLSELAEVVAQEKLLLEEIYDLFRTICVLEVTAINFSQCLINFFFLLYF